MSSGMNYDKLVSIMLRIQQEEVVAKALAEAKVAVVVEAVET
jgi:hypothetical protein